MSETPNPMHPFEAQFDMSQNPESLAERIIKNHDILDTVVHGNRIEHTEGETILVRSDTDLLPAEIRFKQIDGWITVQTADRQGEGLNFMVVNPRTLEALHRQPIDAFTFVAGILEGVVEYIYDEGTDISITDED